MNNSLSCRTALFALLSVVVMSGFAAFGGEDTSCLIELDSAPARKAKATLLAAGTKSADSSYLSRFYYAKPENGQPEEWWDLCKKYRVREYAIARIGDVAEILSGGRDFEDDLKIGPVSSLSSMLAGVRTLGTYSYDMLINMPNVINGNDRGYDSLKNALNHELAHFVLGRIVFGKNSSTYGIQSEIFSDDPECNSSNTDRMHEGVADWVRLYVMADPSDRDKSRYSWLTGSRKTGTYSAGAGFLDFVSNKYGYLYPDKPGIISKIIKLRSWDGLQLDALWRELLHKDSSYTFMDLYHEAVNEYYTIHDPFYQWTYDCSDSGVRRTWGSFWANGRNTSHTNSTDRTGGCLAAQGWGSVKNGVETNGWSIALRGRFRPADSSTNVVATLGKLSASGEKMFAILASQDAISAAVLCCDANGSQTFAVAPRPICDNSAATFNTIVAAMTNDTVTVYRNGTQVDSFSCNPSAVAEMKFGNGFQIGGVYGGLKNTSPVAQAGIRDFKEGDDFCVQDVRLFNRALRRVNEQWDEVADYSRAFPSDYNPSRPVKARWKGYADSSLDSPESWYCVNDYDMAISSVPQSFTDVTVASAAVPNIPAGTPFACRSFAVEAPLTLENNADWGGVPSVSLGDYTSIWSDRYTLTLGPQTVGGMLELAGKLTVPEGATLTLTNGLDLVAGAELRIFDAAKVSVSGPLTVDAGFVDEYSCDADSGDIYFGLGDGAPLSAETYDVMTVGSVSSSALARFKLVNNPHPGNTFSFSNGKLKVTVADYPYVWTGNGGNNLMSTAGNWSGNSVPTNGAAIVFAGTTCTSVQNDWTDRNPSSITFAPGSGEFTITGNQFANVGSIVNESDAIHVFGNNVTFSSKIDLVGDVDFAGGVSGTEPTGTILRGKYTLTKSDWWIPQTDTTLVSGSTLSVSKIKNSSNLMIETNATLTAGNAYLDGGLYSLVDGNYGMFEVTGTFTASAPEVRVLRMTSNGHEDSTGVFKFNKILIDSAYQYIYLNGGAQDQCNYVIGPGGISLASGSASFVGVVNSWTATLRFSSDCTIASSGTTSSIANPDTNRTATLIMNTADFANPAVKRSVTVNGNFGGGTMNVQVKGGGTVTFANSSDDAIMPRSVSVSEGSTVTASAGTKISNGDLTLADGSTLCIASPNGSKLASVGGTLKVVGSAGLSVGGSAPLAAGTYRLLSVGTEPGDLSTLRFAGALASGCKAELYVENGEICLAVSEIGPDGYVWTGAGANLLMSNPDNWRNGSVPNHGGEDVYFTSQTEVDIVCDLENFSPSNLVVLSNSKAIAFTGSEPITNIASVVCQAQEAFFDVPVFFAGDIDVSGGGIANFRGAGAWGAVPVNHTKFYGVYNIEATDWTLSSAITIAEGSSLLAQNTVITETAAQLIRGESGSHFKAKELVYRSIKGYAFGPFAGEAEIGKIDFDKKKWYGFNADFTGTLRVGAINFYSTPESGNEGDYLRFHSNGRFVIGSETGDSYLKGSRGTFNLREADATLPLVLNSAADWDLIAVAPGAGAQLGHGFAIESQGVVIDTSDFDGAETGHTVAVKKSGNPESVLKGAGYLAATGSGTLKFDTSCTFTGGLVASNGVTLALANGVTPGNGDVTMEGGTTLAIPDTANCTATVAGEFKIGEPGGTVGIRLGTGSNQLAVGRYKVLTANGGFENAAADSFSLVNPMVSGAAATFEIDGNELWLNVAEASGDYVWAGGSVGANWTAANMWTLGGQSVTWSAGDDNTATFATSGDMTTVDVPVSVSRVNFNANATIDGSAAITVPSVSVVPSVSAAINAPTAGALEKSGEGTLTLGAPRTDQTTLSEGTLAMANGATVDPSKLTLGTDAAKPVALDYGGNTLAADLTPALGGYDVSLTNGNFTSSAKFLVDDGTLRVKNGASVNTTGHFVVGGKSATDTSATINAFVEIDGGAVTNSASGKHCFIGDYGAEGSVSRLVVKNGGSYYSGQDVIVANRSTGYLTVDNSTVEAYGYLYFCYDAGCLAGENGYVSLTNNGVLAVQKVTYRNGAGNGYFNFDGGTLKATATQTLLEKNDRLFVNVNAAGGTIDNNGKNITINADLKGAGDITFVGSGKTTIGDVQTGTGALNVNEGTVEFATGVTLSRAISVASGATLSVASLSAETPIATASTFAFAGGSTLALPTITAKGKYKLFTLSSGAVAADPLANATITGPLAPYTITAEGNTVYLNIEQDGYVFVDNDGIDSLTVTDNTILLGVGGAKLSSLSFGATSKLTFDPIRTPIKVAGTPTFAAGAKIALSEDYAGMTLGKVVLMTYSGSAAFTQDLFDAASIAPGATFTLTEAAAPDGTSKQLVLTVGDYENEAKEIRILPVGDSITQGVKCSSQNDYPQYRTTIAARLAANGYKPVMKGVWHMSQNDAAGVQQPDEWRWHSGISAERIMIGGTHGGVRDNMHVYLDIAGDVNAITILIGTNDIGSSDRTAEETYAAYTNLLFSTAAQRPNAKIFGSTILDRDDKNDSVKERIAAFDTYLRTDYAAGRLPANYVMLDLYAALPVAESGNFFDKLHPNWKGDAVIGNAFANAIMAAQPLTGEGAISGDPDPTVTDEVQTALGAANIPELADYRSGMTPIFTIDAAIQNGFTSAPYTTTNNILSLGSNVTKVGYYMELVRKGTNRRRYVWVDFDATGKTLGEVDFPWDGENLDFVAEKLHVYSNDPSIHNVAANDNSVSGVVEGTWHNYSAPDDNGDVPSDAKVDTYGWNDTLNTSGNGYGCFQVHRIFNEGEHWNRGEVLFAWNAWGSGKATSVDEIGIGSFAACSAEFVGTFSMDYTFTSTSGNGAKDTLNAEAYSVRRVEIWAVPDESGLRHGYWSGAGQDGNFATAANWEDGIVPVAGDTLDFSGVTSSITINCGDMGETKFGAVTNGTGVITFIGSFTATSFTDTSKVAVGENSTVTLDGNLVFIGSSDQYVVNTVAAGGRFVVTGRIEASSQMTGGQVFQYVNPGEGAVQAKGLVANEGTSDEWTFRLSSDKDGTANWIVGAEGLSGSKNFFAMYNSNRKAAIQPLDSNFTIATKVGIRAPLTLNTTGYDNNGHTITIAPAGVIGRDGALTISGTGKVLVDATNTLSSAVTVTNSATLAIKAGKKITTGKTTIASGAALELPDSATASVVLPGGLVFGDGEGHAVMSLGGLSANVTSLVVNATTLTYYSNKVAVRFATAPEPGTYTILSAPNKNLNNDYAGYLMVEDTALAGKCTFSVSSDKHSVLLTVVGYTDDDGNGGFFNVLDSTLAKLPAGVTDPTVKPAGSVLSYAQADALGLLSDAGEITNELAVVSMTFNENNRPVISVCGAPNAAYVVAYSLLMTFDLASGSWTEVEGSSSTTGIGLVDPGDAADRKFYKVKVVIGNK